MCVCVCGPVFLSSIWILLIPFSSSNPSFSASSSHTLFPSLCPLLFLPPMLVPPAPLPFFFSMLLDRCTQFTWHPLEINMLWWTDAWVPVRRSGTGRTDWRGWALPRSQRQQRQQRAASATRPDGLESSSRHCSSDAPTRSVLPRHGPQHHVTVEPEKIST